MTILENKMNPKLRLILDIIIILLLSSSTFYLLKEIKLVKEQGGPCINNPTGWAMQYAKEKYNYSIFCSCSLPTKGFSEQVNYSELNTSDFFNNIYTYPKLNNNKTKNGK